MIHVYNDFTDRQKNAGADLTQKRILQHEEVRRVLGSAKDRMPSQDAAMFELSCAREVMRIARNQK